MVAATDNLTRVKKKPSFKPRGFSTRRMIGAAIIAIVVALGIFAPALGLTDPNESSMDILVGPSAAHWAGTDELGRDVFSRVIYGARVSLLVGLGVGIFA